MRSRLGITTSTTTDSQTNRPPIDGRRDSKLITPVPKPRKRKRRSTGQQEIVFTDVEGLTDAEQEYNPELKNTGAGNLFVVIGEPDVEVRAVDGDQIEVEIKGVDVFDPQTGEVRSGGTDDIAARFIDTDYDEERFFVRHAYFLGAHDPYKGLKTNLKAEINEEAWASLYQNVSRPFPKPSTGRFAVKVINHVGDEVMKVFSTG